MTRFDKRSEELEIIDEGGLDFGQYRKAFEDIKRVNRYLGGKSALTRHLFPMMRQVAQRRITILDVGTGTADIPLAIARWAEANRADVRIVALDNEPFALKLASMEVARYPQISLLRGDALALPFQDGAFDFVVSSLFLHHLPADIAARALKDFDRVARAGFIVNDLHRHPIAYYFIKWSGRLFSKSEYFRNDAPLSVLRGFQREDLEELKARLGGQGISIHRHFPYRIVLVKRK